MSDGKPGGVSQRGRSLALGLHVHERNKASNKAALLLLPKQTAHVSTNEYLLNSHTYLSRDTKCPDLDLHEWRRRQDILLVFLRLSWGWFLTYSVLSTPALSVGAGLDNPSCGTGHVTGVVVG